MTPAPKITILRASTAGFCFGVQRAVELARAARDEAGVSTLGPLIHNPEVLEELESRGIRAADSLDELHDGTIVIRAHGVSDRVRLDLAGKNLKVIDASCPFVQRIHAEVKKFVSVGIPVVIFGRADHPEMLAVVEDFPSVLVTTEPSDPRLAQLAGQVVGLLAQTTETPEGLEQIAQALTRAGARVQQVATICNATHERQSAAVTLAKQVQVMVVIGGKASNNTKKLWQLTSAICPSYWIENEKELQPEWFATISKVGVTAGASTPESTITRVIHRLDEL